MPSYYRQQLEDYLKQLDVEAERVYDIGGEQKPVQGRTRSWKVEDYRILDLPEYDLNDDWAGLGLVSIPLAQTIFCLEVFEYLFNPLQAMQNIAELLAYDGMAIISAPLVYPVHNDVKFDSLRYTETGLTRIADFVGLKVVDTAYRCHKTRNLASTYSQDGMRAAKGIDHNITGYIMSLKHYD